MRPWTLIVLLACGISTSACAGRPPAWPAAPRLTRPALAERPCILPRLPSAPTIADLEAGYAARGAEIASCDAARRLAVETHAAEHALEDQASRRRR